MFFRPAILVLFALAAQLRADSVAVWTTGGGTARITPLDGLTRQAGVALRSDTNLFALTEESRIKFVTPWGSPDSFLGGSLRATNTMTIEVVAADGTTNGLVIAPLEFFAVKDSGVFELRDDDAEAVLEIEHFDTRFEPGLRRLHLSRGAARLSAFFAEKMDRPELAGLCVAVVDCEIAVHELEARMERRRQPPPFACGIPADANAPLTLSTIEAVQQVGAATNGLVPVGIALTAENAGPAVLPVGALATVPVTLTLLAVKNGATTDVLRIENPLRFDPAARSLCPDQTKFIPGQLARRSLADVVLEKAWQEQRSQAAFGAKTLRAAGLLSVACVGSVLTARVGDARTSPPRPRPKSLAAGPRPISKQAL